MPDTSSPNASEPPRPSNSIPSLLSLLVFFELLPMAAMLALRPPPPAAGDAPATAFSAERAARDVRAIASKPHPVGSPDHDRVLDYLVRRFAELGIPTRIQEVKSQRVSTPSGEPTRLRNLLARMEGSRSGPAVALAAHYDSAPGAPGAADDGAAVAALLETARALRAGAPPKNDVLFIITDGEELGLLGAEAFVREDPWSREIAVVVNFEARGNRGPSILFETSAENGALIRQVAAGLSRPVGNSLAYSIYRLLPNDTDLTVYKRAGLAGVNFAFIDGYRAYHGAGDRPENLSLHSLQHHGEHALSLARQLGEQALPLKRESDVVYFDLCGRVLVVYPLSWARPGVLLVLAALVVALLLSRDARPLPSGLWPVLGAAVRDFLVTVGSVSLGLVAVLWTLRATGALVSPPPRGEQLSSTFFVLGVWNLALAVLGLRLKPPHSAAAPLHHLGPSLLSLLPLILLGLLLPEASYLCVWPGLAGVLAVLLVSKAAPGGRVLRGFLAALLGLPAVVLLVPTTYFLSLAVAPDPLLQIVVTVVLSTVTIGLLSPQLRLLSTAAPRRVVVLASAGALLAFALEFLAARAPA